MPLLVQEESHQETLAEHEQCLPAHTSTSFICVSINREKFLVSSSVLTLQQEQAAAQEAAIQQRDALGQPMESNVRVIKTPPDLYAFSSRRGNGPIGSFLD